MNAVQFCYRKQKILRTCYTISMIFYLYHGWIAIIDQMNSVLFLISSTYSSELSFTDRIDKLIVFLRRYFLLMYATKKYRFTWSSLWEIRYFLSSQVLSRMAMHLYHSTHEYRPCQQHESKALCKQLKCTQFLTACLSWKCFEELVIILSIN